MYTELKEKILSAFGGILACNPKVYHQMKKLFCLENNVTMEEFKIAQESGNKKFREENPNWLENM